MNIHISKILSVKNLDRKEMRIWMQEHFQELIDVITQH